MKQLDEFWENIALDLQEEYNKGHPSTWKKSRIENFLVHFEKQILERCQRDESLCKILGLGKKNGQTLFNSLRIPSYDTFNRIFKKQTSKGKSYTRNLFAIYLGCQSFDDYLSKKNIVTTEIKSLIFVRNNKKESDKKYKLLRRISITKGYKWMMFWLVTSVLIHNIHGINKGKLYFLPWLDIFWIPPILIGLSAYTIGIFVIWKTKCDKKAISIIWLLTILLQIYLNQYIPGWYHMIETASLFVIGIVGQISISTDLMLVIYDKNLAFHKKYQFAKLFSFNPNIVILIYFIGLFFGFLMLAIMWMTPNDNVASYSDNLEQFKLFCTLEILTAFILISIGYRRLILKPVLRLNG